MEMSALDEPQTGGLHATSESIISLFVSSPGLMVCQERTVRFLGSLGVF